MLLHKSVLLYGILFCFLQCTAGRKIVMCYINSWGFGRPNEGRFSVLDANTQLCTHVVYAFLGLVKSTGEIINIDPYTSTEKYTNRKNQLADLRKLKLNNQKLKVLVSIGGWNEKGDKFSDIARSSEKRSIFIRRVTRLISDFELDGVDISWQFPGLRGGMPEDRENSIILFKELKNTFKPYGWLLTVHIIGKKYVIDKYNLKAVSEIVDYINFPALEYHGFWERKTGIMAPLTSKDEHNVIFSVDYALKKGVDSRKLILGLPMYGHAYLLPKPPPRNQFIGLFCNETFSSPWTRKDGLVAYNELCLSMNKSREWKEVWDEESQTPIVYNGRKLISFDNKRSLLAKAGLVNRRDLGGVMITSLDMDDFQGLCHGIKFPLTSAISSFINNGSVSELQPVKQIKKTENHTTNPTPNYGKTILCYMIGSSIRRPGLGKFSIEHINKNYCTHVVYAFMTVNTTTSELESINPAVDKLWIPRFKDMKKGNPHVKLLVSIGGWDQGSKRFSLVSSSVKKRKIFVSSILQFLQENKFDGIDVNWQIPGLRDGGFEDKLHSLTLFKELKNALKPKGYLLTVHIFGHRLAIDSYNITAITNIVDFINFAAFDYNGPAKQTVAVSSPLTSNDEANVKYNLEYILNKGVSPDKVLLGLPLFGHSYVMVHEPKGQYLGLYFDHLQASPWTDEAGFISYNEACYETTGNDDWIEEWDEQSQTPILYSGRKLITYDNEKSLLLKARLVETKGLAGVMIWSLDMDDFHGLCYNGNKYPALSAISRYLSSLQSKPQNMNKQNQRQSNSSERVVVSFEYGSS